MDDLKLIEMIKEFPIGEIAKNKDELLSKAEVVAFLARFQEQFIDIENIDERELKVRQYLSDLMNLEQVEMLPNLNTALNILHLSPDFIQDFGKVQLIKENNPRFNDTYEMIASNLNLVNHHSKTL